MAGAVLLTCDGVAVTRLALGRVPKQRLACCDAAESLASLQTSVCAAEAPLDDGASTEAAQERPWEWPQLGLHGVALQVVEGAEGGLPQHAVEKLPCGGPWVMLQASPPPGAAIVLSEALLLYAAPLPHDGVLPCWEAHAQKVETMGQGHACLLLLHQAGMDEPVGALPTVVPGKGSPPWDKQVPLGVHGMQLDCHGLPLQASEQVAAAIRAEAQGLLSLWGWESEVQVVGRTFLWRIGAEAGLRAEVRSLQQDAVPQSLQVVGPHVSQLAAVAPG